MYLRGYSAIWCAWQLGWDRTVAAGGTYFLDGIAAVFLGQSMFSEGQPHLFGTLLGVLIIGTMNNGFVLLGVSYFVQDLVKGLVIIMAVALSTAGSIERIAIGI